MRVWAASTCGVLHIGWWLTQDWLRFFTHSSAQTIPIVLCVDIAFYIIKCGFSYISFAIFLFLSLSISRCSEEEKNQANRRERVKRRKKNFLIFRINSFDSKLRKRKSLIGSNAELAFEWEMNEWIGIDNERLDFASRQKHTHKHARWTWEACISAKP